MYLKLQFYGSGGQVEDELVSGEPAFPQVIGAIQLGRMIWFAKPVPTQRQPNEDAVEWARRETRAFTNWKCKVYGALLGIDLALVALTLKGMPLHPLWRWLGVPLLLAFACLFTALGFYAAAAIGEVVDNARSRSRSNLR